MDAQVRFASNIHHLDRRLAELRGLVARLSSGDPQERDAATGTLCEAVEGVDELQQVLEELRAAEEELCRQNEALVQAREKVEAEWYRYRELFEQAPDGYLVTDLGGNIQEANRAAAELLNIPPRGLAGKPVVLYVAFVDRPRFWTHLNAAMEGRESTEFELAIQPRHLPPVDVAVRIASVLPVPDKPAGLRWLIRDVTPRKRAERILRASQEQIRRCERLVSVGTLAAGIAHEINNPLHTILLTVQYARRCREEVGQEELNIDDLLETIAQEARRAGRIVKGVQKFARAEQTRREVADLNAVVRHAVDVARAVLPANRLRLKLELASKLPRVEISVAEIEQVLAQLVQNAVESAGRPVRVVMRTVPEPDGVRLTVDDDGPGIPESILSRIFDPFFTTRQTAGATGLGLSVAHSVVADHGGSIRAENRPQHGARITIRLPVPGLG